MLRIAPAHADAVTNITSVLEAFVTVANCTGNNYDELRFARDRLMLIVYGKDVVLEGPNCLDSSKASPPSRRWSLSHDGAILATDSRRVALDLAKAISHLFFTADEQKKHADASSPALDDRHADFTEVRRLLTMPLEELVTGSRLDLARAVNELVEMSFKLLKSVEPGAPRELMEFRAFFYQAMLLDEVVGRDSEARHALSQAERAAHKFAAHTGDTTHFEATQRFKKLMDRRNAVHRLDAEN